MGLSTAESILIFFSIGSLLIVLIIAWQFRAIKQLILGFRSGVGNNEQSTKKTVDNTKTKLALLQQEVDQAKTELKSKTIEMAKLAKENDEKAEALESIRKSIQHIQKNPNSVSRLTKDILAEIEAINQGNEVSFELQLDELNKRFYTNLKEEFSELTQNDLRLCAYIKIGMSAKEISNLLNIKPSSVYISRSRLRKKLGLSSTDDLHGFLASK